MSKEVREELEKELLSIRNTLIDKINELYPKDPKSTHNVIEPINEVTTKAVEYCSIVRNVVDALNELDPSTLPEEVFDFLIKHHEINSLILKEELEKAKSFHKYATKKK